MSENKNILGIILKSFILLSIVIIQILIIVLVFLITKPEYMYIKIIFSLIVVLTDIYIYYTKDDPEYKLLWIIMVTFFPILGLIAFCFVGNVNFSKKLSKKLEKIKEHSSEVLKKEVNRNILKEDKLKYNTFEYIKNTSGYPLYKNEDVKYFSTGEYCLNDIIESVKKAKKYIFIEFFIFSSGKILDEVISILKEKVKENVKVVIILDSLGCLFKLPMNFEKDISKYGIEVYKFNPFKFNINKYLNYRNHRKTVVIDGNLAYIGGINLADEYANIIEKHGYFKDFGMKIKGEAVNTFTIMIIRKIEEITGKNIDYNLYIDLNYKSELSKETKGYILPFEDGPDNRKNPIENVYIQTINQAKDYIYIATPYFIVNKNVLTSILNSSRSGVDVKIVVPYIPDKKSVNIVTKSYYKELLEAGVKIYEFTPGFIHSKLFVSDDDTAIVSNSNLDFRSLNSNFEVATFLYKTCEELVIKKDFKDMFKICIQIKIEDVKNKSFINKIIEKILIVFAPML